MYEGAFRILRTLGDGRTLPWDQVAREAGESTSVVREVVERYPKWFELEDRTVRCSTVGFAALGRELIARTASVEDSATLVAAYEALAASRVAAKRNLDQIYVTSETAVRRAKLLVEAGEHQRGLAFLGDDDLTSAAVQLLGAKRKVTAIELDQDVLRVLSEVAHQNHWELETVAHDLREPLPRSMQGRFGAVFTDPPYAIEGFRLFVSRAIELLKPDGHLYVCFGYSRRASERGLQKQRVLTDAGLLVEAVWEGFNRYHGADSIGAQSALWRCRITPESKPLVTGAIDGPLYTSRPAAPDEP